MFIQTLRKNQEVIILTAIFVLVNFLDAILTIWGSQLGIEEVNPFYNSLVINGPLLAAVKVTFPFIVPAYSWLVRKRNLWLSVFLLWIAIVVYSLLTLSHAFWLVKTLSYIGQ